MELLFGFVIIAVGLLGFGYGQGTHDVTKFGAVGDGKTDDSQAFLKAWGEACGGSGSQTLQIPSGKSFFLQPLVFKGPCKSTTLNVQLQGTLVVPEPSQWSDKQKAKWIIFEGVDGLSLDGSGKIDGRGDPWWKTAKPGNEGVRPSALSFQSCNNLLIKGYTSTNTPRNHISISGCTGATVSNVNLIAPGESPNTDGIDISGSSQVNIQDSFIGTGDDCVAINGGCVGINITNVNCGPGHGLSIGSLGRDGAKDTVEHVRVYNCTFTKTQNGARIKTWPGGSGYAKSISFEQITLVEAKNPIIIDQYYGHCYPHCRGGDSAVEVSDVKFVGFQGTSASKETINLNCSKVKACNNILFEHVNITPADQKIGLDVICKNAHVTSKDAKPPVSCS